MRTHISLVVFTLSTLSNLYAQRKFRYKSVVLENDDVKITLASALSNEHFFKMKFDITKKSKDYLLFKISELKFKVNGTEYNFDDKTIAGIQVGGFDFGIPPGATKTKDCDKIGAFLSKDIQLLFNCIYKVSLDKRTKIKVPDFKLPSPLDAQFFTSEFIFTLKKLDKEKKETKAVFKGIYSGEKIGIIDFNHTKVLMPDGKEYLRQPSEHSHILCVRGDPNTFALDWASIPEYVGNMENAVMIVKWSGSISESTHKNCTLKH
jgi:hypothetical protein